MFLSSRDTLAMPNFVTATRRIPTHTHTHKLMAWKNTCIYFFFSKVQKSFCLGRLSRFLLSYISLFLSPTILLLFWAWRGGVLGVSVQPQKNKTKKNRFVLRGILVKEAKQNNNDHRPEASRETTRNMSRNLMIFI